MSTEILGIDLFISSSEEALRRPKGGDLSVDASGDLAVTSGYGNIQQALVNRIITELGELALHPRYGLDIRSAIGRKHTVEQRTRLRINLVKTLREEPRIKEIKRLLVQTDTQDPRICRIYVDVVPIESEDVLHLNLVYNFYGNTFSFTA